MTANARPTTTIRTVLEMLGGIDYVQVDIYADDLDIPVIAHWASLPGSFGNGSHRGELSTHCSGRCIVGFTPKIPGSPRWRAIYLVVNDHGRDGWIARERDTPYEKRHELGPCPRHRLRLVQSA